MSELDWAALQKEADGVKPIPDGDYAALCVDTDATTSSNGKPMIRAKFRIVEGPQKDKAVRTQFVISAENAVALKIFFQHMAALGLTADYFATKPQMSEVARAMLNRGCTISLGTRTWQGVDRNEIKGLQPFPTGVPTPPGMVTGAPVTGLSGMASPSPLGTPAASPSPVPAAATPAAAGPPPTSPF